MTSMDINNGATICLHKLVIGLYFGYKVTNKNQNKEPGSNYLIILFFPLIISSPFVPAETRRPVNV